MTQADAFLQDILAHPNDDAPRLIFADWLEEQGDTGSVARAEFIRVQCALASGNLPERRRAELQRRERQILEEWQTEWVSPLRGLVRKWKYHRGFIDDVEMWTHRFVAHAGRLFRRAPIQHLTLCQKGDYPTSRYMAVLADNEHLSHLRSLNLISQGLVSQDVRALIISEHLTSLTSLNISGNRIGDSGVRALAGSPLLGRLEHLNLGFNDVGANGLRAFRNALEALAKSPEGVRLQQLEVYYRGLSAAGQRVIVDSALLRRLVF